MLRVFYYTTFLVFLLGAMVFWVYANEFFNWWSGFKASGSGESVRENFVWGVVWLSVACLVLSVWAINSDMKGRILAYLSLLMSAITLVMFFISFFGHGVMPTHGIL